MGYPEAIVEIAERRGFSSTQLLKLSINATLTISVFLTIVEKLSYWAKRTKLNTEMDFSDPGFGVDALCHHTHEMLPKVLAWLPRRPYFENEMSFTTALQYFVYWGVKNMFHSSSNNTLRIAFIIFCEDLDVITRQWMLPRKSQSKFLLASAMRL